MSTDAFTPTKNLPTQTVWPRPKKTVTRESTNRNGRDVGKRGIDLIATFDVSIAPVRDVGALIVEIAPVHLGLGIVKKPTLA